MQNTQQKNNMSYILITWPESQSLMELEGFEENTSLADCEKFGPAAYFVDKDWLEQIEYENS